MKNIYTVNVSNIGNIECRNKREAIKTYDEYVLQSEQNYGKAAGENVSLLKNGEPIEGFFGGNENGDDFLVDCILNDSYNVTILAHSKNYVLAYKNTNRKMRYIYNVNQDSGFEFHLLSEVGQNYVKWFEDKIEELNLKIALKETKKKYYEVVTKETLAHINNITN